MMGGTWPTNLSCLSVSCSVLCVWRQGGVGRNEKVWTCGCEHTHVPACSHTCLTRKLLSVSLPELQHKMNSHWLEATGASGRTGPTHLDFLLACVLETVLWEAVPSKSWTPSVQLLNPWSQDISGIHQVMVPVSSEHWAELQPWEWMPDLMGGSL